MAEIYLKTVFKTFRIRPTPWEECVKSFERHHQKIRQQTKALDEIQTLTPVLIPRIRGIEDSSRYWSVALTCRHLVIVGSQVESLIVALSQGHVPNRKADIAAAKPEDSMNKIESVQAYFDFADTLMDRLSRNVQDRQTKAAFFHPWFGPLTAKDWLWLLELTPEFTIIKFK